jgi:hypothetical protein
MIDDFDFDFRHGETLQVWIIAMAVRGVFDTTTPGQAWMMGCIFRVFYWAGRYSAGYERARPRPHAR